MATIRKECAHAKARNGNREHVHRAKGLRVRKRKEREVEIPKALHQGSCNERRMQGKRRLSLTMPCDITIPPPDVRERVKPAEVLPWEQVCLRKGKAGLHERPRDNRIRNPRRGIGGHRDHRHHDIQAKAGRALAGNLRRHKQSLENRGQSSVEYAIVLGTALCIICALGLLYEQAESGTFLSHALSAASHNIQSSVGGIVDVLCF